MANPEHIALVKTGSECWNQWRRDHPDIVPDLRVAHLRHARLCNMDLSGAILDLRSGVLYNANLEDADLSGADLGSTLVYDAKNLTVEQCAASARCG